MQYFKRNNSRHKQTLKTTNSAIDAVQKTMWPVSFSFPLTSNYSHHKHFLLLLSLPSFLKTISIAVFFLPIFNTFITLNPPPPIFTLGPVTVCQIVKKLFFCMTLKISARFCQTITGNETIKKCLHVQIYFSKHEKHTIGENNSIHLINLIKFLCSLCVCVCGLVHIIHVYMYILHTKM